MKKKIFNLKSEQELNYEIIIVDNASKDNSIKEAKNKFPYINILTQNQNLGYAGGCNHGVNHANGEFLVYNTHINDIWGKEQIAYYHSMNRIDRSQGLTFVISPSDNNYDVKLNGQFIPIEFGAEGVDANVILLSKGDILLVE